MTPNRGLKTILALTDRQQRRENVPYRRGGARPGEHGDRAAGRQGRGAAPVADDLVSRIIAQTSRQSGLWSSTRAAGLRQPSLLHAGPERRTDLRGRAPPTTTSALLGIVRDGRAPAQPTCQRGHPVREAGRALRGRRFAISRTGAVDSGPHPARRSASGGRNGPCSWLEPPRCHHHQRAQPLRAPGSEVSLVAARQARGGGASSSGGELPHRPSGSTNHERRSSTAWTPEVPAGDRPLLVRRPRPGMRTPARCHAAPPARHREKRPRISIVSEMLDEGNRELAEVTQADDFIVSAKLRR